MSRKIKTGKTKAEKTKQKKSKAEKGRSMKAAIIRAIQSCYRVEPDKIEALGGGFYGRVFLVEIPCYPYTLVAKLYLFPGYAEKEAEQLKMLSGHCILKVPEIYAMQEGDGSRGEYDVVLMEYLEGVNAGEQDVSQMPEKTRNRISREIADNLIAIHNTVHEEGFGAIGSREYHKTWQEYYYPIACRIVEKAHALYEKGQLSDHILAVFDRSIENFDNIFKQPITEARLIHGDYNAWNILLTKERDHAAAVIDPFGCCWGDSEYDLYQLDNANGKAYGLLDQYRQIKPLSPEFSRKRCFYELYSEVGHYHDAQVEADRNAVEILADKLEKEMDAFVFCHFSGVGRESR